MKNITRQDFYNHAFDVMKEDKEWKKKYPDLQHVMDLMPDWGWQKHDEMTPMWRESVFRQSMKNLAEQLAAPYEESHGMNYADMYERKVLKQLNILLIGLIQKKKAREKAEEDAARMMTELAEDPVRHVEWGLRQGPRQGDKT